MILYQVTDQEFKPYGRILTGYDTESLCGALEQTPLPEEVDYVPSDPLLESLPAAVVLRDNVYGGLPVQLGWCNGHNTKLNCLEYHRDSEINLGTEDFILLLAKEDEMEKSFLDTSKVRAFFCPAGTMVEVYATTLHYAPCGAKQGAGFRVLVALPRGTNLEKPAITPMSDEDRTLWARNKWLLAHAESGEAAQGAFVGLLGENIDLSSELK